MSQYVMVRGKFLRSPPREKGSLSLTRDVSRAYDFGASANTVARGFASGQVVSSAKPSRSHNPIRKRR